MVASTVAFLSAYSGAIAAAVTAGGLIMQGRAAAEAGKLAEKQANAEAALIRQQAKERQAIAQQHAIQERRKATIMESNARAAAAGMTGSTWGIGLDILPELNRDGEHNALVALWEGDTEAAGLRYRASLREYEGDVADYQGQQTKKLSYIKAAGAFSSAFTTMPKVTTSGTTMQGINSFGGYGNKPYGPYR